ncbi:hypothetical protein BD408DRAFT_155852 [Parasitella parasitica]|nr:hypothetical protein BD408DRAFT_155852 [Parasitella parasitica]
MQSQFVTSLLAVVTVLSVIFTAAPFEPTTGVAIDDFAVPILKKSKKIHDGNEDSKTYSSTTTWYSPKKNTGTKAACGGKKIGDDSEIVALDTPQYGQMSSDSDWCRRS